MTIVSVRLHAAANHTEWGPTASAVCLSFQNEFGSRRKSTVRPGVDFATLGQSRRGQPEFASFDGVFRRRQTRGFEMPIMGSWGPLDSQLTVFSSFLHVKDMMIIEPSQEKCPT